MKRPLIIAFVLVAFIAAAQTISYFNQGFLRQGTAQLDRDYLGIFGSNIFYWGTNTPWTNNNYVLRSGDIMSGVLSNQSDLIVIRGTNDVATLQLEVPNILFPPTYLGVTLQFNTNGVFYLSSLSNQFKGDTYGKSWWGDGFGLTNIQTSSIVQGNTNQVLTQTGWSGVPLVTNIGVYADVTTNVLSGTSTGMLVLVKGLSTNSVLFVTNGMLMAPNTPGAAMKAYSIAFGSTKPGWVPATGPYARIDSSGNFVFNSGSGGNNYFQFDNVTKSNLFDGYNWFCSQTPRKQSYFFSSTFVYSNLVVEHTFTATNGIIQQVFSTNGVTICTTNRQTYLLSGTNELVTLVNAANVPNVIYRFSSTNQNGSFIVTNATGTQTIRDGSSLAYTNSGVGEVGFISDGAHWWLASKGKTVFPNASWSTSTNTTFPNITNTITLQTTDHGGDAQGIGLDNSAWFTFGVGSRIWITNSGDYMLSFSAVWAKGAGSPSNGDIWLRKNGTDVPNTATIMTIAANATNVMTVNLFLNVTAPSYFDLQGASTDGNGLLQALPAITSPFNRPAMPSIIVTVNKISD